HTSSHSLRLQRMAGSDPPLRPNRLGRACNSLGSKISDRLSAHPNTPELALHSGRRRYLETDKSDLGYRLPPKRCQRDTLQILTPVVRTEASLPSPLKSSTLARPI